MRAPEPHILDAAEPDVAAALDAGAAALREAACDPALLPAVRRDDSVAVLLTAASAYAAPPAAAVVGWAERRLGASLPSARVAASEAVTNAIVHGALGLPGLDAFAGDGAAYAAAIRARLADPARARAPVRMVARLAPGRLLMHVDDWGEGFDPAAVPKPSLDAFSGRGLAILRATCARMRIGRGGRRASLRLELR